MYSRAEFEALGRVLVESPHARRLWVVSDEIYDRIVFGEVEFCSFAEACPELRDRVITVNGLSKSAAMTGWRVGWSVAPPVVTQAMATLQGQSTSGINSLAQYAAVEALRLPEEGFAADLEVYRRRRAIALEVLGRSKSLRVTVPHGAFYVFVGVGGDAAALAEELLLQAHVAVVPGGPFGDPGSFRLSFALDDASLREGCERLVRFFSSK
jgi:aspartate aminotransferase